MSKILSLKLKEEIYTETENILKQVHMPRNAYINKAVTYYNKLNKRHILREKLKRESALVYSESLNVLKEFEKFEEEGE